MDPVSSIQVSPLSLFDPVAKVSAIHEAHMVASTLDK